MVFSADDRVLIKVLRQEKGYGAKNSSQNFPARQIWGKLQERVYRSRIHDVDQLKSRLIEEWEQSTRCSSMKRSGSGVHVFQLAFEHTDDILNTYFSYVWYLYRRILRQSYVCAVVYSGHLCFEVTSLNSLYSYCKRWQILFKFGSLFAIRHCVVDPEFC